MAVKALRLKAGFTVIFVLLGVFAGTLGHLLSDHETIVNIVCGAIVVVFGLSYLGIIKLPFFKGANAGGKIDGVISASVFGVIYSVSLTPCVGAFPRSALLIASASGGALRGALLLVVYSVGLGIPFV